jgi:hypothetical protein
MKQHTVPSLLPGAMDGTRSYFVQWIEQYHPYFDSMYGTTHLFLGSNDGLRLLLLASVDGTISFLMYGSLMLSSVDETT